MFVVPRTDMHRQHRSSSPSIQADTVDDAASSCKIGKSNDAGNRYASSERLDAIPPLSSRNKDCEYNKARKPFMRELKPLCCLQNCRFNELLETDNANAASPPRVPTAKFSMP